MKYRVRKLKPTQRPELPRRWVVSNRAQNNGIYFWTFESWEAAHDFALWKAGAQPNYAEVCS